MHCLYLSQLLWLQLVLSTSSPLAFPDFRAPYFKTNPFVRCCIWGFFVLQAKRFQSRITNQPSCFPSEKGTEMLNTCSCSCWSNSLKYWQFTLAQFCFTYTQNENILCVACFFKVCVSKCTSTFSYPQTLACRWCKSMGRLSLWAQWNNIFLLAIDPHSARRDLGDKIRERERKMTISFVLAHWSFQFSKTLCSWMQATSQCISQIGHKTELHK